MNKKSFSFIIHYSVRDNNVLLCRCQVLSPPGGVESSWAQCFRAQLREWSEINTNNHIILSCRGIMGTELVFSVMDFVVGGLLMIVTFIWFRSKHIARFYDACKV